MSDPLSPAARRDIAHHLHPYTNLARHEEVGPLVLTRGEGIHVYDEQGNEYIEGMAGLWCTALGFNEEALVQAATEQLRALPYAHTFAHKSTHPIIALAERLAELAPVPMSRAFFANSGSEANDTAVKLVWYYNNAVGRPQKKKIISRHKGYHGVTVATASLTGIPRNHQDFDLPIAGILHADCPHHYRFAEEGESEEAFATRLAENLERLILQEGPETVAAFIAEPVMGAGGVIVPPPTYFEKVQAVLRRYDVLLIADEVICGFGRTGEWWGSQTFALQPDILTCAKALSSAYLPISAVMVSEPVYRAMVDESRRIGLFAHGFTYSGHPVCAAVALKNLELMEQRGILDHVRRVGPVLQERLRTLADHPLVGEVRGTGLIAGVELVADRTTRQPFDPGAMVGAYAGQRCQAQGLILRPIGDTLAVCPPLIVTEEQVGQIVSRLATALDETLAWVRKG